MSMTSLLTNPGPIKDLFATLPGKKQLESVIGNAYVPRFEAETKSGIKEPGAIGTAYDLWLRAHLQRLRGTNQEMDLSSVAQTALQNLEDFHGYNGMTLASIWGFAHEFWEERNQYICGKKELGVGFIKNTLRFAMIEACGRNRNIPLSPNFEKPPLVDVEDLCSLIELTKEEISINFNDPNTPLIVNPHFGDNSRRVGGADADLLLKHTLIDIKVKKELKFVADDFRQLFGYYLLAKYGDDPGIAEDIQAIALYYPRHDTLVSFQIVELAKIINIEEFAVQFFKLLPE
jgi:hypothetical protein